MKFWFTLLLKVYSNDHKHVLLPDENRWILPQSTDFCRRFLQTRKCPLLHNFAVKQDLKRTDLLAILQQFPQGSNSLKKQVNDLHVFSEPSQMFGLRLNQNRVFFQAHRNCLCLSRLTKINALALHSTFRSWKWDHPSITGSSTWYPTVVSANLPCPDLSMMSYGDNPPLWHLWKTDSENLLQTTFPHSVTRNFKLEKKNPLSKQMQANKKSSVSDGQQHSLVNFVWKQLDKKECHTCASTREISLHSRPKKMRSTFSYIRIYIQNLASAI